MLRVCGFFVALMASIVAIVPSLTPVLAFAEDEARMTDVVPGVPEGFVLGEPSVVLLIGVALLVAAQLTKRPIRS